MKRMTHKDVINIIDNAGNKGIPTQNFESPTLSTTFIEESQIISEQAWQNIKIDTDKYYGLTGSCIGCRRVTWLCRRNRKCSRYSTKPKTGYVANPTGFGLPIIRKKDLKEAI